MADDATNRELLNAAIRKRQTGQKLTSKEQRALDRFKREQDEQQREIHYRTLPKKRWVQWSGRQHKVLAEQASTYGIPLEGETIDLPRVARWIHDLLADHGRKILAGDSAEEIWTGDTSSPALERLREVQYEIKKRELAELDKTLVARDAMRKMLTQGATILRGLGDTLQRQFGPDALDLLNDALADFDRSIEAFFEEQAAAEAEQTDDDEPKQQRSARPASGKNAG
jgi:hypothetical protein